MTTVSVTEVKEKLARLLAQESNGEEIIITQNDRPVGIIHPIKAFTPSKATNKEQGEDLLVPTP